MGQVDHPDIGGEIVENPQGLVEIFLREEDRETHAEARLMKGAGGLTGQGAARRNPEDREATQIGEQIAAARAVSDLAHKLLDSGPQLRPWRSACRSSLVRSKAGSPARSLAPSLLRWWPSYSTTPGGV